jgi:hypothetical protein
VVGEHDAQSEGYLSAAFAAQVKICKALTQPPSGKRDMLLPRHVILEPGADDPLESWPICKPDGVVSLSLKETIHAEGVLDRLLPGDHLARQARRVRQARIACD